MTKTTKMMKTIITLLMALALAFTAIPVMPIGTQTAYAATATNGTIDLQKKALVIPNGQAVKFAANTTTIPKGCKYQVKAVFGSTTVKSNGTWSSTKPAVATVSKTGLVTAKAAGTTTVKVVYGGKSQTVKVKVITTCKHAYKTTKAATCAATGKKLCTLCGKNATIATIAHKWETYTLEDREGTGTPQKDVYVETCNFSTKNGKEYGCHTKFAKDTNTTGAHPKGLGAHYKWAKTTGVHEHGSNLAGHFIDIYPSYKLIVKSESICKTCGKSNNTVKSTKTVNKKFTKGSTGDGMEYDEWLLIPIGCENAYVRAKEVNSSLTPEKWLRSHPNKSHTNQWWDEHAEWARVRAQVLKANTDLWSDPYVPVS